MTTVTVTVSEWVREPPIPVTERLYEPTGVELVEVIVSTDVAVPPDAKLTVVGLIETVRPGGADAERETLPEKPLKLVDVSVEVIDVPSIIVKIEGLAET